MTVKVKEWVLYGPLEVEIEAPYDFNRGEWDGGPGTVLECNFLAKEVAKDLFRKPYGELPLDVQKRVDTITAGIEELAQHHRFSDDAVEFARNVWMERGCE